jgi:sigma-B regulation protein RsbU (phosphoserine phosphatase)
MISALANDSTNSITDTIATLSPHVATVLLVDDQPIVAEAVRRMLADESDIRFHYCSDPTKAIAEANRLSPTVILQDLVMPELDGLTLVKFFRANPQTREIPLIVLSTKEEPIIKAQAFATGANDYLVKLPDKLEMLARIRYHSKGYIAQIERNEAYRRLAESQKQLADEVAQAAKYVCSLLPEPIGQGPLKVDWRFLPSMQLGGDSFGYHWLDDDHFAVYLLDVSGHGVGASLLSVSAMNVLRSQTLPNTDFRDPGQVLQGLNATFDMDLHDNKYFTIWYGVFCQSARQLSYSGGGHPPALLCQTYADGRSNMKALESTGPIIGMMPDLPFDTQSIAIEPETKLYLFSDGVFEIDQPDGTMWKFEEFVDFVSEKAMHGAIMDRLLEHTQKLHGSDRLSDDFSILEVAF